MNHLYKKPISKNLKKKEILKLTIGVGRVRIVSDGNVDVDVCVASVLVAFFLVAETVDEDADVAVAEAAAVGAAFDRDVLPPCILFNSLGNDVLRALDGIAWTDTISNGDSSLTVWLRAPLPVLFAFLFCLKILISNLTKKNSKHLIKKAKISTL